MLQLTSAETDLLITLINEYTDILNEYHVEQGRFSTYTDVKQKYSQIMKLIMHGIIPEN